MWPNTVEDKNSPKCCMCYMVDHAYSPRKTLENYKKQHHWQHVDIVLFCCVAMLLILSTTILCFGFFLHFVFSTRFTGHEMLHTVVFWLGILLLLFGLDYYKCCTKVICKSLFDKELIWQNIYNSKSMKYDGKKWKRLFSIAPLTKPFIHDLFILYLNII